MSNRALWTGVLAGPIAWTIAAGAGYVVAARACVAGRAGIAATTVSVLGGIALLVALAGMVGSYRRWHVVREHRRFISGARADDVGSFLAWAGTVTSGLAAFGSAMILIAPFLLSPCAHAW